MDGARSPLGIGGFSGEEQSSLERASELGGSGAPADDDVAVGASRERIALPVMCPQAGHEASGLARSERELASELTNEVMPELVFA